MVRNAAIITNPGKNEIMHGSIRYTMNPGINLEKDKERRIPSVRSYKNFILMA